MREIYVEHINRLIPIPQYETPSIGWSSCQMTPQFETIKWLS